MSLTSDFISRLNAHDLAAFKSAYERYYKPLALYALQFVGNESEAEDIVQDVMVTFWQRNETFKDLKSFETYLYRCVKFKSLNIIKHNGIVQRYLEENESVTETDQEADQFLEELYMELFHAIDQLPPRCRETMLMSLEGKSNADIAASLQLSIETVKTHRKRALSLLRRTLNEKTFALLCMLVPSL
jgi:RNA polymerase sigma-70 factor (ECF subfamily)